MSQQTKTYPLRLKSDYVAGSIIEFCHFRDLNLDTDDVVSLSLEAVGLVLNLKSFRQAVIPNYNGDETEIEKLVKFNAAEEKSEKIGLQILTRKNNTGDWDEEVEIICLNRGRKDYIDILQPFFCKYNISLIENNDAFAIRLIDYGHGLLRTTDSIKIKMSLIVTISKKNDLEAFEARLAAIELAVAGRFTAVPAMSLLGRNTDTGVVETISQSTFTTPVQVQTTVDQSILSIIEGAPGTLSTLDNLAQAINDDVSFGVNITNLIATKAPLLNSLQLTPRSNTTAGAFDANNWVLSFFFAGLKWLDGGATNVGLPVGINSGMIIQFDPLKSSLENKYLVQIFFSGVRLFFRVQNNGTWGSWRELSSVAVT